MSSVLDLLMHPFLKKSAHCSFRRTLFDNVFPSSEFNLFVDLSLSLPPDSIVDHFLLLFFLVPLPLLPRSAAMKSPLSHRRAKKLFYRCLITDRLCGDFFR